MKILKKEMMLRGETAKSLAEKISKTISITPVAITGWVNGNSNPKPCYVQILKDMGYSDAACLTPGKDVEV